MPSFGPSSQDAHGMFIFFLLWLQFPPCRMAPASAPVPLESHKGRNSEIRVKSRQKATSRMGPACGLLLLLATVALVSLETEKAGSFVGGWRGP